MEELEYIAKKEYFAKIDRLNALKDVSGGQVMCVSPSDPNNKMQSPIISVERGIQHNGQEYTSVYTSFPIYASEALYWLPGKKVKITVEITD